MADTAATPYRRLWGSRHPSPLARRVMLVLLAWPPGLPGDQLARHAQAKIVPAHDVLTKMQRFGWAAKVQANTQSGELCFPYRLTPEGRTAVILLLGLPAPGTWAEGRADGE